MKSLIHFVGILIFVPSSAMGAKEEVLYAQVGGTVTIKPVQEQARYMFWKQDTKSVINHHPLGGWSNLDERWKNRLTVLSNSALTITKLQEDDFGTFTFSILIELTHETQDIYKCYLYKITVNMISPSPLLVGESLELDCNIPTHQKQTKPNLHWLSPQGKKKIKNKFTAKVTSQDNGQWTCVVEDEKESQATISVTVVDLLPAPSPHQYTSKSSSLTIPCWLPSYVTWDQLKTRGIKEVQWEFSPKLPAGGTSKDPEKKLFSLSLDTMHWKAYNNRGLSPVLDISKGFLSLTKRQGREIDGGDYECKITFNNNVTLRRTVHLEVLQISASPGTNLTSGEQLNLTCSIGSALPSDMQLKVFPPDKPKNFDHYPANFTIPEVKTKHTGKWRCELWQGGTRLTSEVIILKIEFKLSVWMQVIICSIAAIVILVPILVYIIYRRKQRIMRHPRHRLCQCKHPKPKGFYKT